MKITLTLLFLISFSAYSHAQADYATFDTIPFTDQGITINKTGVISSILTDGDGHQYIDFYNGQTGKFMGDWGFVKWLDYVASPYSSQIYSLNNVRNPSSVALGNQFAGSGSTITLNTITRNQADGTSFIKIYNSHYLYIALNYTDLTKGQQNPNAYSSRLFKYDVTLNQVVDSSTTITGITLTDIAFDNAGDAIACYNVVDISSGVIKFSVNHLNVSWNKAIVHAGFKDVASFIKISSNGQLIFVSGYSFPANYNIRSRILFARFSSAGVQKKVTALAPLPKTKDIELRNVKLDAQNNLVIAGRAFDSTSSIIQLTKSVVAKYNYNGVAVWKRIGSPYSFWAGCELDNAGNVFTMGNAFNNDITGASERVVAQKFDGQTGNILSTRFGPKQNKYFFDIVSDFTLGSDSALYCIGATATSKEGWPYDNNAELYGGDRNFRMKFSLSGFARMEEPEQSLNTSLINDFSIYPNPANSNFTVAFNSGKQAEAYYSLFNLNGAEVFKGTTKTNEGSNHLSIDISSLPAGYYFFKMNISNGEMKSAPVVKINP